MLNKVLLILTTVFSAVAWVVIKYCSRSRLLSPCKKPS